VLKTLPLNLIEKNINLFEELIKRMANVTRPYNSFIGFGKRLDGMKDWVAIFEGCGISIADHTQNYSAEENIYECFITGLNGLSQ